MVTALRATLRVVMVFYLLQMSESRQKKWYETTTIYEIYTRSFKDSNGDGIGDIKGVLEKLDYIQSVGYETIWVQAFLKSPMVDNGYDISDFKAVDPVYGTINELKELIQKVHRRGMKIMMDFVPNHTSNQHDWFLKSVKKEEPYTDFFIWKNAAGFDPKTNQPIPPNNWVSIFGGPAWEWNDQRKQFYYRIFSPAQPDLDYRNPAVREAMKDVLRFWLDLGIDGFRVDSIAFLVEDALLRDNPWKSPEVAGSKNYFDQIPVYTSEQEETYEVTHEWRLLLDEYEERDNYSRVLGFETFDRPAGMIKYMGNETYKNMHFPFNIFFPPFLYLIDAPTLNKEIREWTNNVPSTGVTSWMMSTHDLPRMATRCFPEFSEAAFMVLLLLPGVASIYYGEEIRMLDVFIRPDQTTEPSGNLAIQWFTRDSVRTPMQWDDSLNAGFTKKRESWLPVNPDYWTNNVKKQLEEPKSHLKTVKRLLQLRKSPVIVDGQFDSCVLSPWLFMLKRSLMNEPPIIVIVNMGTELEPVRMNLSCSFSIPDSLEVHTASLHSGFNIGDKFAFCNGSGQSDCSELRPKAGVVLTLAGSTGSHAFTLSHSLLVLLFTLGVSLFRWAF